MLLGSRPIRSNASQSCWPAGKQRSAFGEPAGREGGCRDRDGRPQGRDRRARCAAQQPGAGVSRRSPKPAKKQRNCDRSERAAWAGGRESAYWLCSNSCSQCSTAQTIPLSHAPSVVEDHCRHVLPRVAGPKLGPSTLGASFPQQIFRRRVLAIGVLFAQLRGQFLERGFGLDAQPLDAEFRGARLPSCGHAARRAASGGRPTRRQDCAHEDSSACLPRPIAIAR